jgi:Flp pilus assembly protein TadG
VTRSSGNNKLSEIAANWLPRRRRSARFKGQSLVELALALPTLLLLMLGTIDVGRMFIGYIEMRNAVFEGARYGSRVPTDTVGIKQAVFDHGVPSGTNVANPTFGGQAVNLGSNSTITVTATQTFTPITVGFLNKYFGFGVFHLKATATMQVMT